MYRVPRSQLTVELPGAIAVFEGAGVVELVCTRCTEILGTYTQAVDGGILLVDAEDHHCA